MSYMQKADVWLTSILKSLVMADDATDEHFDEAKHAIKNQLLKSYRNGQRDCPNCNPKPPRRTKKEPQA